MEQSRRVPKEHRPYLSTKEFCAIAGVSRKALRVYEAEGICESAYVDESNRFKYWTLDQVNDLHLVQMLRHGDVPLKEIGAYASDDSSLLDAAYRQTVDDIRHTRRMLKAVVHRQHQLSDYLHVKEAEGFYLRYLPSRWMALAPASEHRAQLPSSEERVSLYTSLRGVVDVVGWSPTLSFGVLMSLSEDAAAGSRYVFTELASPPMPVVTGSRIVDGGCYRVIDPHRDYPACSGKPCFECARFGRLPTAEEQKRWSAAKNNPYPSERTIMADDLEEPYPTGAWSSYTKRKIAEREGEEGEAESRNPQPFSPTLRPRLMPHEVRLPMGITICALPAGVYLCHQYGSIDQKGAFRQMLDMAADLHHKPFTLQDERAASAAAVEAAQKRPQKPPANGPFVEPFAAPRAFGEPCMAGWHRPLEKDDLRKLTLPTNMALAPEDGFCIACARVPTHKAAGEPRHEFQLLVADPHEGHPPGLQHPHR